MAFLTDNFTATNTDLTAHAPDSGGSWARHPSYASANCKHVIDTFSGMGFAYGQTTTGYQGCMTLASPTTGPASADYDVSWVMRYATGADHITGIVFRYNSSADTGYRLTVWSFNGSWKLARWNAGTETVLNTTTLVPSVGSHTVIVQIRSGTITVLYDGSALFSAAATVDGTPVTPAGQVGLYDEANGSNYYTAGVVSDSLIAADPGAASFASTPSSISANHPANITLTLVGTATTWSSGSAVSVQNSVTGTTTVTAGTWTRTSNTAATLVVTTGAGTGTFTITIDGLVSPALTVATATYQSAGTGNWSAGATWTPSPSAGGPGAGDLVVINNGHTVTVDSAAGVSANGQVTVGTSTSAVGHAIEIKGASSASFGTLVVPSGSVLTLQGYDWGSNTCLLVNRYGLLTVAAGATVLGIPNADFSSGILCLGQMTATGSGGSRVTFSSPATSYTWGTTVTGEVHAADFNYYDLPSSTFNIALGFGWVANAAGTALGSTGNSSLVISSVTGTGGATFTTEVASIAAVNGTGKYYVDYECGVVWFHATFGNTAGFTAAYKHLTVSKPWGIAVVGNTDYCSGSFDRCDFTYMGSYNPGGSGGYQIVNSKLEPASALVFHYKNSAASAANRLARLTNSTFHFCPTALGLAGCTGTAGDPILVTGNVFGNLTPSQYGAGISLSQDASTYVSMDSNTFAVQTGPFYLNLVSGHSHVDFTNGSGRAQIFWQNSNAATMPDCTISGCTIDSYNFPGYDANATIYITEGTSGHPFVFRNNTFNHCWRIAYVGSYTTFDGNVFNQFSHHGFTFASGETRVITGTIFQNNLFTGGISPLATSLMLGYNITCAIDQCIVQNNTFSGNGAYGPFTFGDPADGSVSLLTRCEVRNNLTVGSSTYYYQRSTDNASPNRKTTCHILECDNNLFDGGGSNASWNRGATFFKGGLKYHFNTRNVLGAALFNPSYSSPPAAKSLVFAYTSATNQTIAWGGGTAAQLYYDGGSVASATTGFTGLAFPYPQVTATGMALTWTTNRTSTSCPVGAWLKFTSGTLSGQWFRVVDCLSSTLIYLIPNTSSLPTAGDTFVMYKPEVVLKDSGGTDGVNCGFYWPDMPVTSQTDTGITYTTSDILSVSPGLANGTNYDDATATHYRPTAGSNAIGVGTATNAPALDFFGATRPSPPAIGFAELAVAGTTADATTFLYDSFTDLLITPSGGGTTFWWDLVTHLGEIGATWTRATGATGTLGVTDTALRYVATAPPATYLASGTPTSAQYDLSFNLKTLASQPSDVQYGIVFGYNNSTGDGYRLTYQSFDNKFYLYKILSGTPTTLGTWSPGSFSANTTYTVVIRRRTGSQVVNVGGTDRITAADAAITAVGAVGVYAAGSSGSVFLDIDNLRGVNFGTTAEAYTLTPPPPPRGLPGRTSAAFTVALAASVHPGGTVTVTPVASGVSGTFSPATVSLTDGSRTATFTFTPGGTSTGTATISVSNNGSLANPAAVPYVVGYDPVRGLSLWESRLNYPVTHFPSSPTVSITGEDLYDVTRIFYQAKDYCAAHSLFGGTNWGTLIATASHRFRDQFARTLGYNLTEYALLPDGLEMRWDRDGEALSRDTLLAANTVGLPNLSAFDYSINEEQLNSRGIAFAILARLAAYRKGFSPTRNAITIHQYASTALGHIGQWTNNPSGSKTNCTVVRSFMTGLTCEALIAYWDTYRDTVVTGVPAAVKAIIDWIWANNWLPSYQTFMYGNPDSATLTTFPLPNQTLVVNPTGGGSTGGSLAAGVYKIVYTVTTSAESPASAETTFTVAAGNIPRVTTPTHYPGVIWFDLYLTAPGGATGTETRYYHQVLITSSFTDLTFARPGGQPAPPSSNTMTCSMANSGGNESAPIESLMIAASYAWWYWRTALTGTPDFTYRDRFDAVFNGSWAVDGPGFGTNKEYNEGYRWAFQGLAYRARGDAALPAATTYTLTRPAVTTGQARRMSGNFTVSLTSAGSVSLVNPVTITLSDGGASGTFFPAALTLTTDLPSATFRYRPAVGADPSTVTISVTNNGGLSNPASVTYGVSGTAAIATALSITGPSTGATSSESSPFTVALSPSGSVLPTACDSTGGVLVVTLAYTGQDGSDLLRLTDSELAFGGGSMLSRQALSADTPSFTFVYNAGTAGARTIAPGSTSLLSGPDPTPITYTAGGAPATPATSYTLGGSSSGTVGVASSPFTVTPNGTYTGAITPHSTGSGTFSPTSLIFSGTSAAQTFTCTPSSTSGSPHTISTTASPTLGTDPAGISYTVTGSSMPSTYPILTDGFTGTAGASLVGHTPDAPNLGQVWQTSTNGVAWVFQSGGGLTSGTGSSGVGWGKYDLTGSVASQTVSFTFRTTSTAVQLDFQLRKTGDGGTLNCINFLFNSSGFTISPYIGGAAGTSVGDPGTPMAANTDYLILVTLTTAAGSTTVNVKVNGTAVGSGVDGWITTQSVLQASGLMEIGTFSGPAGAALITNLAITTPGPTTGTMTPGGTVSGTVGVGTTFTIGLGSAVPAGGSGLKVAVSDSAGSGVLTGTHVSGGFLTISSGSTSDTFIDTRSTATTGNVAVSYTGITFTGSPAAYTTTSSAATAYTLEPPTPASGAVGVASGNFLLQANGTPTTTMVVTPSDGGGGIFTPSTVSIADAVAHTFIYTPVTSGTKSISVTHTGGSGISGNPAAVTYTAIDPTTITIWQTGVLDFASGMVGGTTAGFGYKVGLNGGGFGSLVTSGIVEDSSGSYSAQVQVATGSIPRFRWFDGSGSDVTDYNPMTLPGAGGGGGGSLTFPNPLPAGCINLAAFAADTKADGTMRAASSSTVVHFDVADGRANSLTGTLATPLMISITAGTGTGQLIPIASMTGASGSKDGTVMTPYAISPTLDTTSRYYWTDVPAGANVTTWMGSTPAPMIGGSVQSLPPAGTVVSGSGSNLVITGYPAGKVWNGQHLYHVPSGESRIVASFTYSAPNYNLTITGTFSSVTAGDAVCLLS